MLPFLIKYSHRNRISTYSEIEHILHFWCRLKIVQNIPTKFQKDCNRKKKIIVPQISLSQKRTEQLYFSFLAFIEA